MEESPSLVICGSVISKPDPAFLSRLRSNIIHNPHLADLRDGVVELPELWALLVEREPALKRVGAEPMLQGMVEWIRGGDSSLRLEERPAGNAQLAVLTVLSHISEYITYLGSRDRSHRDAHAMVLESLREGGVQGLCIGLLSAISLACSSSETDVARNGAIALRLALCAGALVDLDESELAEPTVCLSTRWPRGERGSAEETYSAGIEAVLEELPQVRPWKDEQPPASHRRLTLQKSYVAVRLDDCSATISAPRESASALTRHLEERGAAVKLLDLRGRYHHTKHDDAFQRLGRLCASLPMLQFPSESRPLVPIRQNDTGEVVTDQTPLHEMALRCILVRHADWYTTVKKSTDSVASASRGESVVQVLALGPVDCVPRSIPASTPLRVVRPMANEELRHRYPDESIAIVGLSCRFPGSETPEKFWETIRTRGVPGSLELAGAFDCGFFRRSPREAEYMDPQHRLALHLAYEALESGGYFSPSSSATDDVGCYVGMSSCDYEDNVNSHPPTAYSFTGTARAFSGGRIGHFFGLTGPSMIIDTACSSSGVAIHTACRAIQSGDCAMALAGGVNLMTPEARSHQNLGSASFLSPNGQCRPFDAGADGYRRGEGGGFVLLKRLAQAVSDGDHILGVLEGSAVNSSKGNRSITLPSGESQSSLYRHLLRKADVSPHQVSYVEAHGTGTQKGDPIECQSIRNVFGGDLRSRSANVRLGSVKGNVGHGEAASGIASLVKVLLMLQNRQIPPQANFSALNPSIPSLEASRMEIPLSLEPWSERFRMALVNNYGASGTNAAMLLSQPPTAPHEPAALGNEGRPYPILLTAHSKTSMQENCRALLRLVESQHWLPEDGFLPSVAFRLAQRQIPSSSHRVSFMANSVEELRARLQVEAYGSEGETIARGPEASSKPVVLVFAGQTGRETLLNEEAYLGSALLRRHLDRCDRAMQTLGLRSLFPRVFQTEPIEDLADLHCIQFCLQYSIARSWIDAGLQVKKMVGHSLGQLTALCVGGVVSLRDALRMISGRALLIQSNWGAERGCMLSVEADTPTVEALIRSMPADKTVEIACYNAPLHHIVVGAEASITTFEDAARAREVNVRRLPISHGFHSQMMDSILPEYQQLLRGITLHRPTIPIEPCSKSGDSWDEITSEMIACQSREPVYLVDAVSRIEAELGACIWLEAGARSTGITMARRALAKSGTNSGPQHSFYSGRLHDQAPLSSLADATLNLWAEGVRVQFWPFHASQRGRFAPLDLPSYQFQKSEHWLPVVRRQESSGGQDSISSTAPEPLGLVSLVGPPDGDTVEFSINQESDDYSTFARGRTVFGEVLLPSSVYMEAASRALALLPAHGSSSAVAEIEQMKVHAPFGLDPAMRLRLTLQRQGGGSWRFSVESLLADNAESQPPKLQASGVIGWQKQVPLHLRPDRPLVRRLHDRCEELRQDRGASIVQGAFVSKILARVARYDSRYLGIQSIASKDLEAVADITMPTVMSQSSAERFPSPPIFDNFLLIAELHASSLGDLADDQVYICNGFDAIIPHVDVAAADATAMFQGPWEVLSTLDRRGEKSLLSDIFVFSASHKRLVLSIMGANMTQVAISSLERALRAVNGFPKVSPQAGLDATYVPSETIYEVPNAQNVVVEEIELYLDDSVSLGSASSSSPREYASSSSATTASPGTPVEDKNSAALLSLLAEHLNCSQGMSPDTRLGDIGLDSLVVIQLQSDIQKVFGKKLSLAMIDENSSFSELCSTVLGSSPAPRKPAERTRSPAPHEKQNFGVGVENLAVQKPSSPSGPTAFLAEAVRQFGDVRRETSSFSQTTGFAGFFSGVHEKQMNLVSTYILEAFRALGCDLETLKPGDLLPEIQHLPKYQQVVSQFYGVLEAMGLVSRSGTRYQVRARPSQLRPSAELYKELLEEHANYRPDHQLLQVTGSRLADCLSGQADPLLLLFQDASSLRLLEDVYVSSPMFSTGNKMLDEFLRRVLSQLSRRGPGERLRILEIGAGTGGTTRIAMNQLMAASNIEYTYTFTDISGALVKSSKKKFEALYPNQRAGSNMEFMVLDIEKPVPASMFQSYDLVISSNCIHATRDLATSCKNIQDLIRPEGGMLCLLELTRPLAWLDCVFGLLDGWWRFGDGRRYALIDEERWKGTLTGAGFHHVDWTDDGSRESQQFRLITAWR